MHRANLVLWLGVLGLAVARTASLALPIDCTAARCDPQVQSAITQQCPCDDPRFTNHGLYMRCVAGVLNRLVVAGTLPGSCKGAVRTCAAGSTCGKAGFVVCDAPILGICDPATGTCLHGTAAAGTCASNADCISGSRCSLKSSATACTARGGVGHSGWCCAACP